MTTIISKRHFFKFYLAIIFVTLLFIAIATGLLYTYYKSASNGKLTTKDYLLPIFSMACYAFAGYGLYRYIANAPRITLDKDVITFNNQAYSLTDIEKITLSGKRPFKYPINFPMEAATLTFRNNETKYIFDDFYSNSWEIKSFLKQVVIDKKDYTQRSNFTIDQYAVSNGFYDTYKGNQLTSLRGVALWGLVGFFAYRLLNDKDPNTLGLTIFFFGFSTLLFIGFSYQMHYFLISDKYFIVRNHNFWWKNKTYNITDIKEIVIETQGKMPNCLRIITKDFRNKLYPAGTLRNKTWLLLKDKLESYNVSVRNECI